jgi:lysozyme
MNIDKLRKQLEIDEGVKYEVYLDHLDKKTFGIGHLTISGDPENDMEVGESVSEKRVKEVFDKDVQSVIDDCKRLHNDFNSLPEECKQIVGNMMFNMGLPKMKAFKKMNKAIEDRDWNEAANQMTDSKWYRTVPNRADRLVQRMRMIS